MSCESNLDHPTVYATIRARLGHAADRGWITAADAQRLAAQSDAELNVSDDLLRTVYGAGLSLDWITGQDMAPFRGNAA